MIIELNIRLDVRGARNSVADATKRAVFALDYLFDRFGPVQARRHDQQVDNDYTGELKLHQNLVVRVNYKGLAIAEAKAWIFALAEALEQDCIAIYAPGCDHGDLIGPRLGHWREGFDINQFTSY